METKQIQIDLDIYRALETLRQSFEETYNDILRREFLPNVQGFCENKDMGGLLIRDGVILKAGTQLRHIAKRSGRQYAALVRDGGIEYDGRLYHSVSKAAIAAAGTSRNGWLFWEYFDADLNQWVVLDRLRGKR